MDNYRYALQEQAAALISAGREIHARGWVPATSGNFSARLDETHAAITVSGRHKGRLDEDDIMVVDRAGRALDPGKRPSAETLLHTQLYERDPDIGAVLHTHSVNATLLSRLHRTALILEGYELLKAFRGIETHARRITVPVFANQQDIALLAEEVAIVLDECRENQESRTSPCVYGYLIAGHGFYTWGGSVEEAMRHLEAFEFLFECEMRMQGVVRA